MHNWAKNVFFPHFWSSCGCYPSGNIKSWSCYELDKGTDVCGWFG